MDARLLGRVSSFVAVSIALHAFLLVAYAPRGAGGGNAGDAPAGHVLHAVIVPGPSASPAQTHAPAEVQPATPVDAPAAGTGSSPDPTADAGGGIDIPRPDVWFTGAEVSALAEPLVAPKLVYPQELEGTGLTGIVRIRLFVDERGRIRKAELVRPGAHPAFDAAALKAWESVRFRPARKNGAAVKSQKLLEVEFRPV